MITNRTRGCAVLAVVAIALDLALAAPTAAQIFKVLYTFSGGADGSTPEAPVLVHGSMIYGTTFYGGSAGDGVVYSYDLKNRVFSLVHTFEGSPDGYAPTYAGLLRDAAGDLFVLTAFGGSDGVGTVCKITDSGAETVWSFDGKNGRDPESTLVRDATGIYGTTYADGPRGYGTVFRLGADGAIATIHGFDGSDGGGPHGATVLSGGYLYGVTYYGGGGQDGTIYRVDLKTGAETVLYEFTGGSDGGYPIGGLTADSAGNLYGTTSAGGLPGGPACTLVPINGCGTIFKLDTAGNFTTVYEFTGITGADSWGALVVDSDDNLYGTTDGGGIVNDGACQYGCGTVFKIDGAGNFTTLYRFTGGAEGAGMLSGVTLGPGGMLYGATQWSAPGAGVLFALEP